MKAVLSITHDCNLNCSYCYSGMRSNRNMSFETAEKIVKHLFNNTPPDVTLDFSFFGGEPLLHLDLIRDIVAYIKHLEARYRRMISLSITSNGTLINHGILEYLRKEGIKLCISIDGNERTHDSIRKFANGHGSYNRVIRAIEDALLFLPDLQVNAVYTQDSVRDLPETVSFFISKGIPSIHLNPDICGNWSEESRSVIGPVFRQLAGIYVQNYLDGNEIALNCIDTKIIVFLKGGYQDCDKCGMGDSQLAFAPSGNIYPCERFIGEDNDTRFQMGNIQDGIDPVIKCRIVEKRGNRNPACLSCKLAKYCMNWCGCTNYMTSKHTDFVSPLICHIEKSTILAAEQVLRALQQNPLFTHHFFRYAQMEHAHFQ